MTIPPLPTERIMKPVPSGCFYHEHGVRCNNETHYTIRIDGRDERYCDRHLGRIAGFLILEVLHCDGVYWLTDEQWQTFDECANEPMWGVTEDE
jgi:hypothetical protein